MSPRNPADVQREIDDLRRGIGYRMHTDGDFVTAQSLLMGDWAGDLPEEYMQSVFPRQTQAVADALREAFNAGALAGLKGSFTLPVLDHEHDWVDTTVLEDNERVEICAAGGCTATRTVPR